MATATLSPFGIMPPGTVVAVYNPWQGGIGRSPSGEEITESTVEADGTVTFTGLTDATQYQAYALVDGVHRYVHFGTDEPESVQGGTPAGTAGGDLAGVYPNPSVPALASLTSRISALESGQSSGLRPVVFTLPGAAPAPPKASAPYTFEQAATITRARMGSVVAPGGGPATVAIRVNLETIATVLLEDGETAGAIVSLNEPVAEGDQLTVNLTARGVSVYVEDVAVQVTYT